MSESVELARRALFEKWYARRIEATEEFVRSFRHKDSYFSDSPFMVNAWQAFNAALDAVVIELPVLVEPAPPEDAFDDSWRDGYSAADRYRKKCCVAIESTGLGIKIK